MSLIVGLDHVNLLIDAGDDALPKARAFYEGLLGLEPLDVPRTPTAARQAHGTNAVRSNSISPPRRTRR